MYKLAYSNEAKEESEFDSQAYASDMGLTLMGAITDRDNNVILLKFKESGKVTAFRIGYSIELNNKHYAVTKIDNNYLIVSEAGNPKGRIQILKEGFANLGKKVASQEKSERKSSLNSYSEEGFERKEGEIRITPEFRDDLIKKKLGSILMQASAEPVVGPEGIEGFRLDQIETDSIYEKSGLNNGDIVTSINGIPLNDVTKAIKLLQSLKDATRVDFEVKRSGKSIPMTIEVN